MGRSTLDVREGVPLAPLCTLGVGGPARALAEVTGVETATEALAWAEGRGLEVRVLGGGSNLVVADRGVEALVLHLRLRGVEDREADGSVELWAAAGEPWDDLVRMTVERGWAGLECLSGIPGLTGATPIQNVGAYGQEVSERVVAVRVLDRRQGQIASIETAACGFGYRDSRFRRAAEDFIVLGVTFRLSPGGEPTVRYPELAGALRARGLERPTLADVRRTVLEIRRAKSMVVEPTDENHRSCGSFFLNPVVSASEGDRVAALAGDPGMPRWPQGHGQVKLSAAWLIERAGFRRGQRDGPVGLSTRHALAVVALGDARARDVVAFARRLRDGVEGRFGVRLRPEPVFWGFPRLADGLPELDGDGQPSPRPTAGPSEAPT